jgi:TPR repeat protein
LASILARNGPTVNSSGPVLPDKSAKPADKTNPAAANANSNEASTKDNTQPENKNASASADSESDEESPVIDSNASAAKPADTNTADAKAGDTKTGDTKVAKSDAGDSEDNADGSAKAAAPYTASKNTDEDENSAKPESDGPAAKGAKAARKTEVADEEPPQPKTLGEKDPLLVQADKYIQGRGVRKNCSTGINLLRQAVGEGNPAASVKLGALYWSGTCVTQSKVTAYQWFSRAHSMEPTNRWVERSRNSLWASMSPEEQRKTSY